jgi:hypothetical protein
MDRNFDEELSQKVFDRMHADGVDSLEIANALRQINIKAKGDTIVAFVNNCLKEIDRKLARERAGVIEKYENDRIERRTARRQERYYEPSSCDTPHDSRGVSC